MQEGRQPFFKKPAQLREEELKDKFTALKEKGGLKKFVDQKKKRMAGEERKARPM